MNLLKIVFVSGLLLVATAAFSQAQQSTQFTSVNSGQSANDLFGRAMWAGERAKYAEERSLLQTLMQSYPDSDLVPRAKCEIADAWYAEGDFKAAETEYRDFVAFFPDRPEASEARHKIDAIASRSGM